MAPGVSVTKNIFFLNIFVRNSEKHFQEKYRPKSARSSLPDQESASEARPIQVPIQAQQPVYLQAPMLQNFLRP